MQHVILCASSGVTPMKRSALPTSALLRVSMDEGESQMVSISKFDPMPSRRSGLSSMSVISWRSREKSFAKWVPTAPAPAIMIFIIDKWV